MQRWKTNDGGPLGPECMRRKAALFFLSPVKGRTLQACFSAVVSQGDVGFHGKSMTWFF